MAERRRRSGGGGRGRGHARGAGLTPPRRRIAKLPPVPPHDLADRPVEYFRWPRSLPLWRIADAAGRHPVRFGAMRSFGPLPTACFDPHPEPPADGSGELVSYAAIDLVTAIAERFQHSRILFRADPARPVGHAWRPTRVLRLIDLCDTAALAIGASHAVSAAPTDVTRRWARALRAAFPAADGLRYSSSMSGRVCVALWAPAADSFPAHPALARALDEPIAVWQDALRRACAEIGYTVI